MLAKWHNCADEIDNKESFDQKNPHDKKIVSHKLTLQSVIKQFLNSIFRVGKQLSIDNLNLLKDYLVYFLLGPI